MKLKSFFAGSVEAALGLAREELGSEAVLVNSRKAPPEARHLGEYEVVAAWLPGAPPPSGESTGKDTPGPPPSAAGEERIVRQMEELRRQLERMRRAVWRVHPHGGPAEPWKAETLAALAEAEVDAQLAREIAACVEARLAGDPLVGGTPASGGRAGLDTGPDAATLEAHLKAELGRRFAVDATLGRPGASTAVVALVGPAGAGKPSTLAKLAVHGGLARRKRTLILSLDTFRVGSGEPLRTYASVLGVALQTLSFPRALDQALEEAKRKELILIDTPGFGPSDMDAAEELAEVLATHPAIDTHLILPATMKSADLHAAVDRFEAFRPAKIAVTRVDETSTLGAVFSEAARTGKAISYLAAGQQVPDDLEAATPERIVELILERPRT
jgi:flagellar biosynthesis protein FlhF